MSPRITKAVCCSDDPLPVVKTYHFRINCLHRFRTSIIHHQSQYLLFGHHYILSSFINQFLLIRLAPHLNLENIPAGSSTMKTNQGLVPVSSPPGQHVSVSCKKNKQTNKRGSQTLHYVTEFLYILSRWSIMSCTLQSAFEEGCYLLGEGSTLVSDLHFQCEIYTLIFHKKLEMSLKMRGKS